MPVFDGWHKTMLYDLFSNNGCKDKTISILPSCDMLALPCREIKINIQSAPSEAPADFGINNNGASNQDVQITPSDEAVSVAPDITEDAGAENHYNSPASSEDAFAAEVIRLVNEERAKAGLSLLAESQILDRAAFVRCGEIMTEFSHTRPDGSSCFTALQDAGAVYSRAGENIAIGQTSPAQVVQAWMDSPGHRANILNEGFRYIGVSARPDPAGYGGYAWVQVFSD
ncbi:MAG: hypothetical protein J6T26_02600 [Firmicutes bacterium]|nr:hypothetical protein [Bacillota bacterium]